MNCLEVTTGMTATQNYYTKNTFLAPYSSLKLRVSILSAEAVQVALMCKGIQRKTESYHNASLFLQVSKCLQHTSLTRYPEFCTILKLTFDFVLLTQTLNVVTQAAVHKLCLQ